MEGKPIAVSEFDADENYYYTYRTYYYKKCGRKKYLLLFLLSLLVTVLPLGLIMYFYDLATDPIMILLTASVSVVLFVVFLLTLTPVWKVRLKNACMRLKQQSGGEYNHIKVTFYPDKVVCNEGSFPYNVIRIYKTPTGLLLSFKKMGGLYIPQSATPAYEQLEKSLRASPLFKA